MLLSPLLGAGLELSEEILVKRLLPAEKGQWAPREVWIKAIREQERECCVPKAFLLASTSWRLL